MNIAAQNDAKRKHWNAVDCEAQGAIVDELDAARKWMHCCNPNINPGKLEAYEAGFVQGFSKGVEIALKLAAKSV